MKMWVIGVAIVAAVAGGGGRAEALCETGGGDISKRLYVNGTRGAFIFSNAHAERSVSSVIVCQGRVRAETWLHGLGGRSYKEGYKYASPVHRWNGPAYGVWTGTGKFWFIKSSGTWHSQGSITKSKDLGPAPVAWQYEIDECEDSGGDWVPQHLTCEYPSPLVIDMLGDGLALTDATGGVWFDLDADGWPEQVSWTRAATDDGFVVLDRNGNGRIDDGSELFGNATPIYPTALEPRAAHGFEALDALQHPLYGPSVMDDRLDGRDALYRALHLWVDGNHDGLSQPDEIQPLAGAGVRAISTRYRESRRTDEYGNELRFIGRAWVNDPDVRRGWVARRVIDVFFRALPGTRDEVSGTTLSRR